MKLLLADDHTLFRDALVQYIIRSEPDAEISLAKDLYEVLEILQEKPDQDLVLLDLYMPGMNGMEGFEKVREGYRDVPLALMSGLAEEEDVLQAIDLGAVGYFPKTLSGRALLSAIHLVLSGERYIPIEHDSSNILPSYRADNFLGIVPNKSEDPSGVFTTEDGEDIHLTPRERDVLNYLAMGVSNKEIARELELQVVTVKLHVRGICRKLNVSNRTQAALKAHHLGLVTVEDSIRQAE